MTEQQRKCYYCKTYHDQCWWIISEDYPEGGLNLCETCHDNLGNPMSYTNELKNAIENVDALSLIDTNIFKRNVVRKAILQIILDSLRDMDIDKLVEVADFMGIKGWEN